MTIDGEKVSICEHCGRPGRPYEEECDCDESKIGKVIKDILNDEGEFWRQPEEGKL